MTRVLVTGAAGFVARHLAARLREEAPDTIVGADVRDTPAGAFDESIRADLTSNVAMQRVVKAVQPDLIFHLAGAINGSDDLLEASNLGTSQNLIDAVRDFAPSAAVVLVGSAAEYGAVPLDQQPVTETFIGAPQTAYGRAKSAVSRLAVRAAAEGMDVKLARPFNLVGPGVPTTLMIGGVAARLRAALAGAPPRTIRVGNLNGVRDYVSVEDVADGLVRVSRRGRSGEAYNLCSGVGRRIGDIIASMISLTGETILLDADAGLARAGEVDALVGSWDKARTELGWAPLRSFDEGLLSTWTATALEPERIA
ncbi:MAG: NAD-dependent epimerase/dehydratase family protein [Gemmatimonadaceae bacterium]